MSRRRVWVAAVALVAGCTTPAPTPDRPPTPQDFIHCGGHGCAKPQHVALATGDWAAVQAIFASPPVDARAERGLTAQAIARLELASGALTGTQRDRGGTFGNVLEPGQLDCQDEALNTATYLTLLAQDQLLRFHEPDGLAHRGLFWGGGWPHSSAVLAQRSDGQRFAVDSWFLDNGAPPFIVPLESWLDGWRPPPSDTGQH